MTQKEFQGWIEFYRAYPFDDLHRYHRPAALISTSMAGGEIRDKIEWLQPEILPDDISQADVATMKAFGFKPSLKG